MKPTISVIMSIYKEPLEWIRLAVDSILNQTYKDFELIIVCDNPEYTEGKALIFEYARIDNRIIIIENEENIGLTKSLNKAIEKSQGIYIARMDADDISLPDRFKFQVDYLDNHLNVSVIATNTDIIDEKGEIIRYNNYRDMPDSSWLFLDNPIAHSTVMFRRHLIELRKPLYNELYRSSQDYELWSFLLINDEQFYITEQVFLLYRKSINQISQKNKQQQLNNSKVAHKQLFDKYLCKLTDKPTANMRIDSIIYTCETCLDKAQNNEKKIIEKMLYIAYLNGARNSFFFKLRYLFNRRFLVFKYPIRLSLHILMIKYYESALTKLLYL